MKPVRVWVLALAGLWIAAGPLWAQKAKDEKDKAAAPPRTEKFYFATDLDEFRRRPMEFKDKDVRVRDSFEKISDIYPKTLQRKGFTAEKYLEFQTSSSNGSNMTCYLPKSEKDSVSLASGLSRFAPVLLEGSVYGLVNGMAIFIVDHIYSGHEVPRKQGKPQITMIMQWQGDAKKYTYDIAAPGMYVLTDPTTGKKINVEFQY